MKILLRYLFTLTLCPLMIAGANPVCAEEEKPVGEKIQAATPATDKKVLETEKPTGDLSVSVLSALYSNGVETSRNSAIIQPSLRPLNFAKFGYSFILCPVFQKIRAC